VKIMQNYPMLLTSPDFKPFGRIPDRFTCEGDDVNPSLNVANVPVGTKSFALIVDDADAITPEGPWVHWLIWNINAESVHSLGDNTVPPRSVQGKNSFGKMGWGGPCPPPTQPHNYRFMLFALNDVLDLPAGSNKFQLDEAMKGKILAQAELIGEYSRPTA
jgi:hypothetical protein